MLVQYIVLHISASTCIRLYTANKLAPVQMGALAQMKRFDKRIVLLLTNERHLR